jgi:poly-gamma-glutamate capsule biosynthesis protein CapA/YwtB (metallophosphatase superfamily)
MLGRRVAERLEHAPAHLLFEPELVQVAREADLFVLNLECCISERGQRRASPRKKSFFRAPPAAVEVLGLLGVDCVTLANNHALDFGTPALLDTLEHLRGAGIQVVGAGTHVRAARAPVVLEHGGFRLAVLGAADHVRNPGTGRQVRVARELRALTRRSPGIALADLRQGLPRWLRSAVRRAARRADAVLVTPHWGPNWLTAPLPEIVRAAAALRAAGATLVAGHSAHVFQGVEGPVLYDLGDLLDDYPAHPERRNDLGLFWLVDLAPSGPVRLEAVPIEVGHCHTRLARSDDAAGIARRFRTACAAFGTEVRAEHGRLVVQW